MDTTGICSFVRRAEALESRLLLSAQPVGSEFQINTTSAHSLNSIAMDAKGDFAVAWMGGPRDEIVLRRYDAAGVPLGDEFWASDEEWCFEPSVAMDAKGDFVVAWHQHAIPNPEGGWIFDEIMARRFGSDGQPLGDPFHVNQYTSSQQVRPKVAMDAQGDFVVTWLSWGQAGGLFPAYDVYARRYNAAGAAQGEEFLVNQNTYYRQQNQDVSMNPQGDFVIAWDSITTQGDRGITLRRYEADGTPLTDEVSAAFGDVWAPHVALTAAGISVIAYDSALLPGEFTARLYGPELQPLGGELMITDASYAEGIVDVAARADGGFVVLWGVIGPSGFLTNVYTREFDAAGVPQGDELRVNSAVGQMDGASAIAMDPDGDYVVTWMHYSTVPGENSANIIGRRFAHPPTVRGNSFDFRGSPPAVMFKFSEDVSDSLAASDLQLVNETTGQTIDPSAMAVSWDSATFTATFTFPGFRNGILPNGNYRAMLAASSITDPAGNPMQADATLDFFVLAGDANRDRRVDQSDLQILASNWQATGKSFSQGDFNYDGKVDVTDLGILATNWQRSLPAVVSPTVWAAPARTDTTPHRTSSRSLAPDVLG